MCFAIKIPDCDRSPILIGVPMTKRNEKRINKSLLVNISQNGFERMGITVNISRRGMCIATTEIFPVQSEFQIFIAAADDIYALTGLVVWNTKKASSPGENVPAGLGVRIKSSDRGYIHYIKAIANNAPLPLESWVKKARF
jgi:hypothetical protein